MKLRLYLTTSVKLPAGHNLKEIQTHRGDSDKGLKFFTTLIDSCSNLIKNY